MGWMTGIVLLALLVGIPVVLLFWLRSNAAVVFLALCTGSVVAKYVSNSTNGPLNDLMAKLGPSSQNYVQIGIILLPAVITALLLRQHVSGAKMIINIIPAAMCGLAVAVLVVPLLPYGAKSLAESDKSWTMINQYQPLIFAGGALVSFLLLWSDHRKRGKHHGKHH